MELPPITNQYIQMIADCLESNALAETSNATYSMYIYSTIYQIAKQYGQLECDSKDILNYVRTNHQLCLELSRGFQHMTGPTSECQIKIYCDILSVVEEVMINND